MFLFCGNLKYCGVVLQYFFAFRDNFEGMIFLNIINIGILAHVDAGKTTVTENLLYLSGAIKNIGRVDSGNTQTDSMELERKHGITIRTSAVSFDWNDNKINILDTPGHTDFISEVERSISVLDGAVLVVSAVEGIQAQTLILFSTLKRLKIPAIIFVNKIDRIGSDSKKLLCDMKKNLSQNIISLQEVYNEGTKDADVSGLYCDDIEDEIIDGLSDADEKFLECYLSNEKISKKEIVQKTEELSKCGAVYPVFYGSALKGIGMEELMNAITMFLPASCGDDDGDLSASVFKIDNSKNCDKKVYVRIFGGSIKTRDNVTILNKNSVQKVKRINTLKCGKQIESTCIKAGDIGIVYGISSACIGDVLGVPCSRIKNIIIAEPSFKARIYAENDFDNAKLYEILKLISEEDPMLDLEAGDVKNSVYINLFGKVQMEILHDFIKNDYGIEVKFSDVMTIYKETPLKCSESVIHLNEQGNPFRAGVGIKIEPLKRGEGIKYSSDVTCGYLMKTFQNAVEEAVYDTLKQGLLGWQVTDLKVTLTLSDYDSVTSTPSAFRDLTPMVLMDALNSAGTYLLEPLYDFELKAQSDVCGRVISDLSSMRAVFDNPVMIGEDVLIRGIIPADTSKDYKIKIASYTEGKGMFVTKFRGFQNAPYGTMKKRDKIKFDPLNRKMYVMYKLNAIR